VSVDGHDIGRTPITARDLAKGSHRVQLSRDGYTPVDRRVTVTDAKPAPALTVTLQKARPGLAAAAAVPPSLAPRAGALDVESRPAGAQVFVDGKAVGVTPLVLSNVAPGEHDVRLEESGYRSWSSNVRVVAGERLRVAASLEGK